MATKKRYEPPDEPVTLPADTPDPPGYTKGQVMAKLSISRATVQRMIRDGELTEVGKGARGQSFFDPEEVDAMVEAKGGASTVVMSATEFMSASTALVTQAHKHLEEMHQSLTGPIMSVLGLQQEIIKDLTTENNRLRDKNLKMLVDHENMLSLQAERDIAREKARADIERGQKTWEWGASVLQENIPVLLEQLAGARGFGPAKELISRIIPEQLEAMETMGAVTKEQGELIREFWKRQDPKKLTALRAETRKALEMPPEEPEEKDSEPPLL